MHTDDTEVVTEAPAKEEAAAIPATEIAKAVRKAKKRPKAKASKRGPVKKPAKAAKTAKAKKPAKAKAKPEFGKGTRRGPKGNPPEKVARHGNAAYGARVRKARMAKEWSQVDLGKKLGLGAAPKFGQPTLSNIENGTTGASAKLQAKLAKLLGVKPVKVEK